ncbi:MAG: PhzF family phenazine biosynthesis protein [Micavibrio aeruginosavorus]|uniref:PhzF family phenazine biosynthesis protein n=1 Tax=Micavibrio aeruginosavorus TaxID=349221 RepID=A0A7T5UFU2_9BACT|nr:MAG: PhzF family phenazine biosynthesis protein [Micavibrio aeruginosavorus]
MGMLRFEWLNAFTRRGADVQGNPATIAICSRFPSESEMKRAATLLGTNMTSFVVPASDPHTYQIRHFSPDGNENHVCGHATIAAAESLARKHPEYREGRDIIFLLNKRYGINEANQFQASIEGEDITLTMPAIMNLTAAPDGFYKKLIKALGIRREDSEGKAYYASRIDNYVLEIKNPEILESIRPNFNRLVQLAKLHEFAHEGVMLTSRVREGSADIMTRVFLPAIGVNEDVACGSSMCSVVPYWKLHSKDDFGRDKNRFVNIFPYPPGGGEGRIGGVQNVAIDVEKAVIKLTGQVTYHGSIKIPTLR